MLGVGVPLVGGRPRILGLRMVHPSKALVLDQSVTIVCEIILTGDGILSLYQFLFCLGA